MSDWKKVSTEQQKTDETWKPVKADDALEGLYVDVRDINKKDGTTTKIYVFQKEDGTLVSVWDSAGLTRGMEKIAIGSQVRIVYLGKKHNDKTGHDFHSYDIYSKKADEVSDDATDTAEVAPDDVPF